MSDSFSTNALQTAWRITTTELECRLELAGGELRWQLARLGADALPFAWAPLASIMTDGQTPHWRHGEQIKADQTVGGPSLTVALQDAHERVRLEVTVELFDRKPFVRTSALLHNTSDQPVTVTDAEMLHLAVQGAGLHTLFHVEQFSWPYRSDFFSQQQAELVADRAPLEIRMGSFPSHYWAPTSCAWFALRAGLRDEGGTPLEAPGLVAGVEFNGKSRLVAERDAAQITLASTIDDLAHTLAPGASFELPACPSTACPAALIVYVSYCAAKLGGTPAVPSEARIRALSIQSRFQNGSFENCHTPDTRPYGAYRLPAPKSELPS